MADVLARALQRRLHNEAVPWKDRLKLGRKACVCKRLENVVNREMIVTDWITSLLDSHEILVEREKESLKLWNVLFSILKEITRRRRRNSDSKSHLRNEIRVTSSFLTTVQKWLEHLPLCQNKKLVECVVRCSQLMVDGNAFDDVMTRNVDVSMQFVSVIFATLCHPKCLEQETRSDLKHLLNIVLKKKVFFLNYGRNDGIKVFTRAYNSLLIPAVSVLRSLDVTASSGAFDIGLRGNIEKAIGSLLFNQHLQVHFIQIFTEMFSDSGEFDCPQFLLDFLSFVQSDIFTVGRTTGIKSLGMDYGYLFAFLHQSFRESYKNVSSNVLLQFFVILCRLLGIDRPDFQIRLPDIFTLLFADNPDSLSSLCVLLEGCVPSLLVADDKSAALPFLTSLTDFLVHDVQCRNIAWYSCVQLLLTSNPLVFIKRNIGSLLMNVWLAAPKLDSTAHQLQCFIVCQLFDVYAKLRQIPKLISKFLSTLCDVDTDSVVDDLRLPKVILDKFGQICLNLYPQHAVEIWTMLQVYIVQKLSITDGNQSGKNLLMIHSAIDLLKSLLSCARLADRDFPKETFLAIVDALESTSRSLFRQLVQTSLDFSDLCLLHNSLQLIYCWGELNILLMRYDSKYSDTWHLSHACSFDSPISDSDLSPVHDCIRAHDWKRVSKICRDSEENLQLKHTFLLLVLQKLKAQNVFGDSTSTLRTEQQQSVTRFVTSLVSAESKISVEGWASICRVLPQLAPTMVAEDVDVIATAIVSIFVTVSTESCVPSDLELLLITRTLLEYREFHEIVVFQTAIITSSLKQMSTMLTSISEGGNSKILIKTAKMLKPLFRNAEMWLQSANTVPKSGGEQDEMYIAVSKASHVLCKILAMPESDSISFSTACFMKLLELLERLPLEYIFPGNQMRCFIQVFSILRIVTESSSVGENEARTAIAALRIVTLLFDGRRSIWLFNFVRAHDVLIFFVGPFMDFLQKTTDHCETETAEEVQRLSTSLLRTLANYAIKDRSAFADFENFLDKMECSPYWTMRLNVSRDHLTVVSAMTLLKAFRSVLNQRQTLVDVCIVYCIRLLNDVRRWFSVIRQNWTALASEPKFAELMVSFLEAFVVSINVKRNNQRSGKESQLGDNEIEKEFVPTIVDFILAIPLRSFCHERTSRQTLCDFLCAVTKYLQELRPFLRNDIVETIWKLSDCCIESSRESREQNQIEEVVKIVIEKSNVTEFGWILQSLLSDVAIGDLTHETVSLFETAVFKWSVVVRLPLTFEKDALLKAKIGQFFVHCQHVLFQAPSRAKIGAFLVDIVADIIVSLNSRGHLLLVLHICSIIDLNAIDSHDIFVCHFDAVNKSLNNLMFHHERFVSDTIVAFVSAVHHLTRSVMIKGQQHLLKDSSDERVADICECAEKVQRLLTQMSKLESGMAKLAPYVVANFVTQSTAVTLYPPIKNTLTGGIYAMLSLCLAVDIPPLLASLTESGRQVFNLLHANYKKRYCYTGKV